MIIEKKFEKDGIEIHRITNSRGYYLETQNIGAGIRSIVVPDREGKPTDVVLGYREVKDYYHDGPCFGKTPGRYANRINRGRFTLDGKEYQLPVDANGVHLHGGKDGFANLLWKVKETAQNSIVYSLCSPDGDMGYPSTVNVLVKYTWTDNNTVEIEYQAVSDGPTVLNLTNHTYWNLSGEDAGSILTHRLRIPASRWLPTDDLLVPTGEMASVENTPMDFRIAKPIGRDMHSDFKALKQGKGYDNCWLIDSNIGQTDLNSMEPELAAILTDDRSGIELRVFSNQPAAQVYCGNWLGGSPISKSGRSYNDYDGVAIECQGLPNAPNTPGFPSQVLRKGETYRRKIRFEIAINETTETQK